MTNLCWLKRVSTEDQICLKFSSRDMVERWLCFPGSNKTRQDLPKYSLTGMVDDMEYRLLKNGINIR